MNDLRKKLLFEYLYPTEEVYEFCYGDLYLNLLNVLEKKICFSKDNLKKENRENNLIKAKNLVKKYIEEDFRYYNKIKSLYKNIMFDDVIDEILWGYIIFITPKVNYGTGADVFWDKRSIYYKKISILDLYSINKA